MSQPRRKRRRRRGPGRGGEGRPPEGRTAAQPQETKGTGARTGSGKRRRRRRGGGERPRGPATTLESILGSFRTPPDAVLTAEPDGQDIDEIIGELQSKWGVPQYPQEYRITIKVAEERPARADRGESGERPAEPRRGPTGAVRERAPGAPRVAGGDAEGEGDSKPRKRRRRGRRRGRGGGGAGS